MKRLRFLMLLAAPLAALSAEPPAPQTGIYRMIMQTTAFKISFLDDPNIKTLYLDANSVEQGWPMTFGGADRKRFKCIKGSRASGTLTFEEVATKRVYTLVLGQECVIKNP